MQHYTGACCKTAAYSFNSHTQYRKRAQSRSPLYNLESVIDAYPQTRVPYNRRVLNYDDSRPMQPSEIMVKFGEYYNAKAKSIEDLVQLARQVETAEERINNYFTKDISKAFMEEAAGRGYKLRYLTSVGVFKEETDGNHTAVAAADTDLGTLLFSKDFGHHVRRMSRETGIPESYMRDYVISHELGHILLGIKDEQENEKFLEGMYLSMAEKATGKKREAYLKLARYSRARYHAVPELYRNQTRGEMKRTALLKTNRSRKENESKSGKAGKKSGRR